MFDTQIHLKSNFRLDLSLVKHARSPFITSEIKSFF